MADPGLLLPHRENTLPISRKPYRRQDQIFMANNDNKSLLNQHRTKLSDLLALHEETPWSQDVIVNDRNRVRVVYNQPGEAVFDLINPDNDEVPRWTLRP
jgi:hypothetical protein